jgi:hypothetical protein
MGEVHLGGRVVTDVLDGFAELVETDDMDPVWFALAAAVGSYADTDPLWGLIIGPPSSGKTEIVRSLDGLVHERLDDITAAGLLGIVAGKKPRPTGLLHRRQGRIFATIADFSTVLATADRGSRDLLFALLRRAFDGHLEREIHGVEAPLTWTGRLTLLAAATPAIDRFASHETALGSRWLTIRPRDATATQRLAVARRVRSRTGATLDAQRADVRDRVTAAVTAASRRLPGIHAEQRLGDHVDDVALVAALVRGAVERSGYGRREIIALPVVEEPARLVAQLDLLARCLLALGRSADDARRLLRRVALDGAPPARRVVLEALTTGEALTVAEIARQANTSRSVIRAALEELAALGVATYDTSNDDDDESSRTAKPWRLCGDEAPRLVRVIAGCCEKEVAPSPSPLKDLTEGVGTLHLATPEAA